MNSDSTTPAEAGISAEPETFGASSLSASLTVQDLNRSRAWYHDLLGFSIDNEHVREGKLIAISLKAGAVRILVTEDDGARGTDRIKGEGISLMITTSQNIDAIADRIREHGGTLETEPVDTPWGARVFRVKDPDGFKLVFSSER